MLLMTIIRLNPRLVDHFPPKCGACVTTLIFIHSSKTFIHKCLLAITWPCLDGTFTYSYRHSQHYKHLRDGSVELTCPWVFSFRPFAFLSSFHTRALFLLEIGIEHQVCPLPLLLLRRVTPGKSILGALFAGVRRRHHHRRLCDVIPKPPPDRVLGSAKLSTPSEDRLSLSI